MRRWMRRSLDFAGPIVVYGTLALAMGALLVASYGPPTKTHYELLEAADQKLDNIQHTLDESNDLIERLERRQ